jgi:hypothetical protein
MSKFQPGQSGNPGGRPKVISEIQALAREHKTEAIDTLVAIMRDEGASAAARVSAATAILDRGFGKATQTIESNLRDRPLRELTDAELNQLIHEYGIADLEVKNED